MLETKYGFEIAEEPLRKSIDRLTNQIWKLIPMREKEENYQKQLNDVILEVSGLHEIFLHNEYFLQALVKLEGLKSSLSAEDFDFFTYRKVVFDIITLLRGCLK